MNKNAQALYDDLKNSRLERFDMHYWNSCGTPSCIGGHAGARMLAAGLEYEDTLDVGYWLGLSEVLSEDLFYPDTLPDDHSVWFGVTDAPYRSTQPEAAEALKRACELSESALRPEQNQL